jgi:hypothetical protein
MVPTQPREDHQTCALCFIEKGGIGKFEQAYRIESGIANFRKIIVKRERLLRWKRAVGNCFHPMPFAVPSEKFSVGF